MNADAPTLMVVDDDRNIRALLQILFELQGYQVLLAPDGEVGLSLAETRHPNLIVLDVAMPQRSGMDVYLDLANSPHTADIPIIILSAALTWRDQHAWQALPNVAAVMTKPFNSAELLGSVAQACALACA